MKKTKTLIKPIANTALLTCMLLFSYLQLNAQTINITQQFPVKSDNFVDINYDEFCVGRLTLTAFDHMNTMRMTPLVLSSKLSHLARLHAISTANTTNYADLNCPAPPDVFGGAHWFETCDNETDGTGVITEAINDYAEDLLGTGYKIKYIVRFNITGAYNVRNFALTLFQNNGYYNHIMKDPDIKAVGISMAKDLPVLSGNTITINTPGVGHYIFATEIPDDDVGFYEIDKMDARDVKPIGENCTEFSEFIVDGSPAQTINTNAGDIDGDGIANNLDSQPWSIANDDGIFDVYTGVTSTPLNLLANDKQAISINSFGKHPGRLYTSLTTAAGTASFDSAAGTMTYTPAAGETGTVQLFYKLCDTNGTCGTAKVVLNVIDTPSDTTAPTISYAAAVDPIEHVEGTAFTMPNVTANDNEDGDITASIGSEVKDSFGDPATIGITTPVGSYTITYNVSDAAGNAASPLTINVNVAAADTTAPAKPTVTSLTTNNQKPTITGTYDDTDATLLEITVNGNTYSSNSSPLITTTNNEWELNLSSLPDADMLQEGTYDVAVTTTDLSGNASYDEFTNDLIIDITDPAPATITSNLCFNTGTPTITGTWDESNNTNLRIEIIDGILVKRFDLSDPELTSDGSGNWTLNLSGLATPLTDGTHSFSVITTDEAGNSTPFTEPNFIIDSTTTLAIPTVTAQVTQSNNPVITGTLDVNATELIVEVNSETYSFVAGTTITPLSVLFFTTSGNWTLILAHSPNTLPEGTYDVIVTTIDDCSNSSTDQTTVDLTVDTTAPTRPTVTKGFFNTLASKITGTWNGSGINSDDVLSVTVNGVTYVLNTDVELFSDPFNNWELDLSNTSLTDGVYPVDATVEDEAGNSTTDDTNDELTIDTVPPPIPTVDRLVTDNGKPILTGTWPQGDELSVEVNGVTYALEDYVTELVNLGNSRWELDLSGLATDLPNNSYNVIVTSSDLAGNFSNDETTDDLIITNDITAPDIPTVNKLETNTGLPILTGTWDNSDATNLTVQINSNTPYVYQSDGELTSTADGTWTLDLSNLNPELQEGIYQITVYTSDPSTNSSTDETIDELVIDTTPPNFSLKGPNLYTHNEGQPFTDPGVDFTDPADASLTVISQAYDGTTEINLDETTLTGAYTITYNVSDQAGNAATEVTRAVNVVSYTASTTDTDGDTIMDNLDADDDNDGALDVDDNHQLVAVTLPDNFTAYLNKFTPINVLANDDFSIDKSTSGVTITRDGGNAQGTVNFNDTTGEMLYKPDISENVGDIVTVIYEVCANDISVEIGGHCESQTVTITIGDALEDTDLDGIPNVEDPDIDGDGILNENDLDPLAFPILQDDIRNLTQHNLTRQIGIDVTKNDNINFSDYSISIVSGITGGLSGGIENLNVVESEERIKFDIVGKSTFNIEGESYTFTYGVCGKLNGTPGVGGSCGDATVTINIVPVDQDTDNDGNPDFSDPNPNDPISVDDTFSMPYNETKEIYVLDNDDFSDTNTNSITIITGANTTAQGSYTVTPSNSISYTPLYSEIDTDVTIEYQVCNTLPDPDVCNINNAILTISVTDVLDTDGDGIPDVIDPDDDNDGNPDNTDLHPLVAYADPDVGNDVSPVKIGDVAIINALEDDDFLEALGIEITNLGTGTALGQVVAINNYDDPNAIRVELEYTPDPSEVGQYVTINYSVCNTNVSPQVCAESYVSIEVLPELDNDGDGNPNSTDPNIDTPTAEDDSFTTSYGTGKELDILANDDFLPGNGTTVEIKNITSPVIDYTHPDNFLIVNDTKDNIYHKVAEDALKTSLSYPYTTTVQYEVCYNKDGGGPCVPKSIEITILDFTNLWVKNNEDEVYYPNNVGIGTNNPEYELDVVGIAQIDNMLVGDPSHPLIDTTNEDNFMLIDGFVHISHPKDPGEANRWAGKYDDFVLWVDGGHVCKDMAFADQEEGDWSDFVFDEGYDLPSLKDIETHIKENGHMHTMPSEADIIENGYSQTDMNKRMLQTIEELTLHIIEQDKKIKAQSNQQRTIDTQNERIEQLIKRLNIVEAAIDTKSKP